MPIKRIKELFYKKGSIIKVGVKKTHCLPFQKFLKRGGAWLFGITKWEEKLFSKSFPSPNI